MQAADITGCVLAGGQGRRMGGLDKGLQDFCGAPLALHALQRLAPQVGQLAVSANRHLEDYARFGVPVWTDTLTDKPGPLGGFLAALQRCPTRLLMTVPCDAPGFPIDLVERLAAAMTAAGSPLAMAATRRPRGQQPQPVFCLMDRGLEANLLEFTQRGEFMTRKWGESNGCAWAVFDDETAFANINTLAELQALQAAPDVP